MKGDSAYTRIAEFSRLRHRFPRRFHSFVGQVALGFGGQAKGDTMPPISITEAKPGVTVEIDGDLFQVIDYKHIKMAQQAVVKLKLKNMITGSTVERSFRVRE